MSTTVCDITLRYVSLGDIVDPANHRSVFDALTCVASRISKWSEEVEEFTWWIK
jgi:hypothetical protein